MPEVKGLNISHYRITVRKPSGSALFTTIAMPANETREVLRVLKAKFSSIDGWDFRFSAVQIERATPVEESALLPSNQ